MKLRVSEELDIVRVRFSDNEIDESDEVLPGTIYDYDKDGNLVGIEFLNASKVFGNTLAAPPKTKVTKSVAKASKQKADAAKLWIAA
ncbi:MAG TPA: DUF2283 domain-containing protein [Capsulimonadaceae bacterium]|jgi:uncharacterized protein YuzE